MEKTEAQTGEMSITGAAGTKDLGLADSLLGHCHLCPVPFLVARLLVN